VVVGGGVRKLLPDVLPASARRVAIVTQEGIAPIVEPGVPRQTFTVGTDESAKSLTTVEALCRGFAEWGLTRGDAVVAVGGGLVTDVGGFAAAVYHRGVPVVHVPTTLLGMVDASVGGKTGVNLPEGKNLVGAFWQPAAVLCDLELLDSLPEREWRSGYGEMAKYHFLTGVDLLDLPLDERVARCVAIKAEVVAADERESDRRASLNYGHTLAHALEIAGRHDLRHGEAVGIGLVFAAELARTLGRIDTARVDEHVAVVEAYGLDPTLPPGLDPAELIALMGRDKKAVGGGLTFVLDGPAGVELVRDVDPAVVLATLARMAA
jgi:5-deoxy-5-amino-3-dehydroquinate synthase